MNRDRKLNGQIIIAGEAKSLGNADIFILAQRMIEQILKPRPGSNGVIDVQVRFSSKEITAQKSGLAVLESEFTTLLNNNINNDEEIAPGLTSGQLADIFLTPEYQAWSLLASNPEKRIGVSQEDIDRIRHEYATKYPIAYENDFPRYN